MRQHSGEITLDSILRSPHQNINNTEILDKLVAGAFAFQTRYVTDSRLDAESFQLQ